MKNLAVDVLLYTQSADRFNSGVFSEESSVVS